MTVSLKCRCPTCGHPILPTDPLAILPPTPRAVFDVIYAAGQVGTTRNAILERVWCGRERTPESHAVVSVVIGKINKRIRYLGMRIEGSGKPKFYRVVSIADHRNRYSATGRSESAARRHLNGVSDGS